MIWSPSGGLLDPLTEYYTITGTGENNQHGPLLAIVFWRGALAWNQAHTPAERARSDSIFRWTRLRAASCGFGSLAGCGRLPSLSAI
jgi:hypothetical protein